LNTRRYYLNGKRVNRNDYVVHGEDDGFLRGLSAFETMRSFNQRIFRADAHIARLLASAAALGIPTPDPNILADELLKAVEGYACEARVQVTLTIGGSQLVSVVPMDLSSPGRALRVTTLPWEPPVWLTGRVKHCSRAAAQVAQRRAGVDEVFWIGDDGCFTEGARTNIFAVVGGRIITPPDDGRILCGVTRAALLEAGKKAGLPIDEAPLHRDTELTELYASSTLRNLAPVVELDGIAIPGSGALGEALSGCFRELVSEECGA